MRARAAFVWLLAIGLSAVALLPSEAEAQKKKRQRDVVTRDEIQESPQRDDDLHTALRSLRPRFLEPPTGIRTLGNSQASPTVVIIDGKPMGDLSTLRSINASEVDEARYMEPAKAGTEFGNIANGGAVVVKLFKAPKVTKTVADSAKPATPH